VEAVFVGWKLIGARTYHPSIHAVRPSRHPALTRADSIPAALSIRLEGSTELLLPGRGLCVLSHAGKSTCR
jgi:hypothetical protein